MRITPRQRLGAEHHTLAEIFRANGYDTGAFISTAALNQSTNLLRGSNTVSEVWQLPHAQRYQAATKRTVAWLRKPREKPFFAWVHYNNAHQPYRPTAVDPDMFIGDAFYDPTLQIRVNEEKLSLGVPSSHPNFNQIIRPDLGGTHPSATLWDNPGELAHYVARYDAAIFSLDRMLGRLLAQVRQMGLLERTIVVVVGDHGEALGEHDYFFAHGRLPYDDCTRVPLIIRLPDDLQGKRIPTAVAAFDMAPTVLDMAGIEAPAEMEATSLRGIMDHPDGNTRVFTESGYQWDFTIAVRERNWKLIHIPNEIDRKLMTGVEYELYNLQEDPDELHNLLESKPELATRLQQVLAQWSEPWVERAYGSEGIMDVELEENVIESLRALGYLPSDSQGNRDLRE